MAPQQYGAAFGAASPGDAVYQLSLSISERILRNPLSMRFFRARFPVALLFVRGTRRGLGAEIVEQVVSSFNYLDRITGDVMDIILVGWTRNDESLTFNEEKFMDFKEFVENSSNWQYSGESDLLLVNFELDGYDGSGIFNYSEAISLPLDAMARDKHIGSIDELLTQMANSAKRVSESSSTSAPSPVWEISDDIAVLRTKKDLWAAIKKFFLKEYAEKLTGLSHFAAQNLQGNKVSPFIQLPKDQSFEISQRLRAAREKANQ